jgi:hypothetical protein
VCHAALRLSENAQDAIQIEPLTPRTSAYTLWKPDCLHSPGDLNVQTHYVFSHPPRASDGGSYYDHERVDGNFGLHKKGRQKLRVLSHGRGQEGLK